MQLPTTPSRNRNDALPRLSGAPVAAIGWLALLAGCAPAGMPMTELPPQVGYVCQQGGPLTVLRAADGRQAEVIAPGHRFVLPRVDSAAQEKYSNGRATLYLEGENAVLTEDSLVLAGRCASTVALPVVERYRY
jgi:membrane-bound inhibitor of C-type lysozyme